MTEITILRENCIYEHNHGSKHNGKQNWTDLDF